MGASVGLVVLGESEGVAEGIKVAGDKVTGTEKGVLVVGERIGLGVGVIVEGNKVTGAEVTGVPDGSANVKIITIITKKDRINKQTNK